MEFVAHEGEVVFLGDEKKGYMVVQCLNIGEHNFLALKELPKDIDAILNGEDLPIIFAKEVVEGDDYFLDEVIDERLIEKFNQYLVVKK